MATDSSAEDALQEGARCLPYAESLESYSRIVDALEADSDANAEQ